MASGLGGAVDWRPLALAVRLTDGRPLALVTASGLGERQAPPLPLRQRLSAGHSVRPPTPEALLSVRPS